MSLVGIGILADRVPADPARALVVRGVAIPVNPDSTIRLASFNIHSGKGGDEVRDLLRTAQTLGQEFDVAGLYEVRASRVSRWSDQAAELGERLGFASVFAATERQWGFDHFGNAVLARRPLSSLMRVPLPGTRGKAFRNAVVAAVPLGDATLRVIATHIDVAEDRRMQLQQVIDLFLAFEPPVVLMGDLNTIAKDPLLVELLRTPTVHSALHDALPDGPPDLTIDWLFHRGLQTVTAKLVETPASDHPAVFAELKLPDESVQ